jgi:hypothetical protein
MPEKLTTEEFSMSHRFFNLPRTLAIAVGMVAMTAPAFCQLNSSVASVALNATLAESLAVSATPGTVTFTLVSGGTANGSAPVVVTTNWVLNANRSTVTLTGYFSTPTAALTSGGASPVNIPSSEVLGEDTSTGSLVTNYTAFTASGPVGTANGGLELSSQAISSTNRASSRTDSVNLEINLASQPQLPAGSYTGTLNLEAQAL